MPSLAEMLVAYVSAGLNPEHFWELSIWEYQTQMRGAHARIELEQDQRAWLAWHIEALHRQKDLMPLSELTGSRGQRAEPQKPEDQQAMFYLVASSWGAMAKQKPNR